MIRSQNGFSILQLLIGVAILSIVMVAFSDVIIGMQKEVGSIKSKQDRIFSNYVISQALTTNLGLNSSTELLPQNEILKACIKGGSTSTCTDNCCIGERDLPLTLVDPRDLNPDPNQRQKLGGPPDAPISFDRNGAPGCTQLTCAYKVITTYKARCPGGVAACGHAESISTTISIVPEANAASFIKAQTRKLLYFVNINYPPQITTINPQQVNLGDELTVQVYGNPGHPSEQQNFAFEKCSAQDPTMASITCFGFINGVGTIVIRGNLVGTTKVTLQINDGGLENNLSSEMSFDLQVIN